MKATGIVRRVDDLLITCADSPRQRTRLEECLCQLRQTLSGNE